MKTTLLILFISVGMVNLNFAQTTFAALQNIDPDTEDEPYKIASGDLDADGNIDIVMATNFFNGGVSAQDYIKWYKGDGAGGFTLQTTVSSSSTFTWINGLIIADIDGQHGNDIVATSAWWNKLVYFPSDGAGGFGSEVIIDDGTNIFSPGQVFAADINLDGNLDLGTTSYFGDEAIWYAGDGSGGFGPKQTIASGTGHGPFYIGFTDFDGDLDMDALVGYIDNGDIEIYYNQYEESGTMTVSWIKDDVIVDSGFGSGLLVAAFADVNNDNVMDVVKLNNSTGDVEWFNKIKNGTSTPNPLNYDPILDEKIIARPGAIMIADLDNDTFDDVIITDFGSIDDAVIWFKGADSTDPSTVPTLVGDNNYLIPAITVDDFDKDGDNDIAFVGNGNDTVDWYENELINLGTDDNSINNIRIYPNPTAEKLYIKSTISEDFRVTVFDLLGKKVMDASLNKNNPLDVSQLHKGLYFINFEDYNTTYKFVKK